MAQTLTALPALTTPVTLAQSKTLCQNMQALVNLAPKQIKAISVIALIHELSGRGGTDYRTTHAQLRQDTAALLGGISIVSGEESKNKTLIQAVLDWNAGRAADAALSADVNTLLAEAKGFLENPEEVLNRVIYLLEYKLAV